MKESKEKILFFYPGEISIFPKSGSEVRPLEIKKELEKSGYDIYEIDGPSSERIKRIKKVLPLIIRKKIKFAYLENRNLPFIFCGEKKISLDFFWDFFLFIVLKVSNTPRGLFYRDIYWRMPNYTKVSKLKRFILFLVNYIELVGLNVLFGVIFIPSMQMANYFPFWIKRRKFKSLPPGCLEYSDIILKRTKIITYIGGSSDIYDYSLFINAVQGYKNIKFRIFTRKEEFKKSNLQGYKAENIEFHFLTSDEIRKKAIDSDAFLLHFKPSSFWDVAIPIKLFDYIRFKKPVIYHGQMAAAEYIEKSYYGWKLNYDLESIKQFLDEFADDSAYAKKLSEINSVDLKRHLWSSRVEKISNDLLSSA